jgi:hypothetical protein
LSSSRPAETPEPAVSIVSRAGSPPCLCWVMWLTTSRPRIDAHKSSQAPCRPRCCPTRSNKIDVGLGGSPTIDDKTSLTAKARSPRQIATSPRAKLPQIDARKGKSYRDAVTRAGCPAKSCKSHPLPVTSARCCALTFVCAVEVPRLVTIAHNLQRHLAVTR